MYMHLYLCGGMCTLVQVPSECREGVRLSGAEVVGNCEHPDMLVEN